MISLKRNLGYLLMSVALSNIAYADQTLWHIVTEESTLTFTGTQNNAPVLGSFKQFSGDLHFNPQQLSESNAVITIDTNSISTSYAPIADTLKTDDWFDSKKYPQAVFKSNKIVPLDTNHYSVEGELTIKGKTKPVTIKVTLEESTANTIKLKGEATVKRTDFDLGQGEWSNTNEIAAPVNIRFSFSLRAS